MFIMEAPVRREAPQRILQRTTQLLQPLTAQGYFFLHTRAPAAPLSSSLQVRRHLVLLTFPQISAATALPSTATPQTVITTARERVARQRNTLLILRILLTGLRLPTRQHKQDLKLIRSAHGLLLISLLALRHPLRVVLQPLYAKTQHQMLSTAILLLLMPQQQLLKHGV